MYTSSTLFNLWFTGLLTMAEGLEEKLLELKESFSKEDSISGSQKGHDIVGDIGHICLHDLTEKDIGEETCFCR